MATTNITSLYELYSSVKKAEAVQTNCDAMFQSDFRHKGINSRLVVTGDFYTVATSWREDIEWHTDTSWQLDQAGAVDSQLNKFSRHMAALYGNKYISARVVLDTILKFEDEAVERKYAIDELLADFD